MSERRNPSWLVQVCSSAQSAPIPPPGAIPARNCLSKHALADTIRNVHREVCETVANGTNTL